MYGAPDASMLFLTAKPVDQAVINALESSAAALGHETGCCIANLGEVDDLALFVFTADPWSVIAIDEDSIVALKQTFGGAAAGLAPGTPIQVDGGYQLVAVPGFAECLGDDAAKKQAWVRLKAARHPGNPLA